MDIRTAPIDLIYKEVIAYRNLLTERFSISGSRGKPRIATINVEDPIENPDRVMETLEFYPTKPSKIAVDMIFLTGCLSNVSFYHPLYHILLLNRAEDFCMFSLAEEVTHSVAQVPEAMVEIPHSLLRDFNSYAPDFGNLIHEAIHASSSEPQETWIVNLNEFFPPLGQSILLGEMRHFDFVEAFRELICSYSEESLEGVIEFRSALAGLNPINNSIEHLSYLAAEILLKNYGGDVDALLREHTHLAHLNGTQLWTQYCEPLLSCGKL